MKDAEVLQLRDRVLEAFEIDARLSAREVERRVQMLERARAVEQARRAGELLLVWYADVLAANAGLPPSALSNVDRAGEAARAGSALGAEEIGRRVRLVEEMISACEQNVNPALAMNVALTRMASRPGEEGYLL